MKIKKSNFHVRSYVLQIWLINLVIDWFIEYLQHSRIQRMHHIQLHLFHKKKSCIQEEWSSRPKLLSPLFQNNTSFSWLRKSEQSNPASKPSLNGPWLWFSIPRIFGKTSLWCTFFSSHSSPALECSSASMTLRAIIFAKLSQLHCEVGSFRLSGGLGLSGDNRDPLIVSRVSDRTRSISHCSECLLLNASAGTQD